MTVRADPPVPLYQAVLDRPDDDAPRLACAAWYVGRDELRLRRNPMGRTNEDAFHD